MERLFFIVKLIVDVEHLLYLAGW